MLSPKGGIVSKTYRHVNRYSQILAVLFKYGFGDLIDKLNLGNYLKIGLKAVSGSNRRRLASMSRAERIRLAFEELGPTFTKMGQILSTRPDLVPAEFIREFTKLQDNVPPFTYEQAAGIIREELKAGPEELFLHFEKTPLAAASIGQVHRARLLSGEDVVVKVQRPGIRKTIEIDLEILLYLAELMEKHVEEWSFYRPTRIVGEFARILEKEIDFEMEASYMERFARCFAGNGHIRVPAVYRKLCTEKVLTMEYIEGIKVTEVEQIEAAGLDPKIIASRGADLMLEQVFKHGLFHADPHPGNIIVLPGNVICYFDFGMMGVVDRHARENFADIVYGYVHRDEAATASALLKIVEWEQEPDRRALEKDISEFMESYLYRPLKELRLGDLLQQLIALIARHRMVFPPDIFLMIKVVSEIEGIGLKLDPDFDITEKAAPFIRRIKLERLHPGRVFSELADSAADLVGAISTLPGDLSDFLKQTKQGKTRIGFEHRGLENLVFELDRSTNRIAFALIISSLIIGSSLIITTDVGPYFLGYPIIGIFGYLIAGIFGIWLIVSIFRSGKV